MGAPRRLRQKLPAGGLSNEPVESPLRLPREQEVEPPLGRSDQRFRALAPPAKELDQKAGQRLVRVPVVPTVSIQHDFNRRIGDQPAVAEQAAVDFDQLELGEKAAAREEMFRLDPPRGPIGSVEDHCLARLEIGGDDTEPHIPLVQPAKVDELLELATERPEVIEAQRPPEQQLRRRPRREDPGPAHGPGMHGHEPVGDLPHRRLLQQGSRVRQRQGRRLPEGVELGHPPVRLVAGDDRGIDRTDRRACEPAQIPTMRLVQLGIGTALIGAERDPAREHQRNVALSHGPSPQPAHSGPALSPSAKDQAASRLAVPPPPGRCHIDRGRSIAQTA
jgi:hypothetical protein